MMLLDGKFSINGDRGLLKPKLPNINLLYVKNIVEPKLRELAKGRKGENGSDEFTKVYPKMVEEVEIVMPIDEKENFDIETQKDVVDKILYVEDIKKSIEEYKYQIENLTVQIENTSILKKFTIDELFDIKSGNSNLTQKFLNANKGEYVVYSANTKENGVFGYIKTFDFDIECIQITTNGVYAGTVFFREKHKFSINSDARLLIKKNNKLDYNYLTFELISVFADHGFNWENKPTIGKIKNIELSIPINEQGLYDIELQKEISEKHKKIQIIKKSIIGELDRISKIDIDFE